MQVWCERAPRARLGAVLSLMIALLIGGCASLPTGPAFSSMHRPGNGTSRVVVYPNQWTTNVTVNLDGRPMGTLRRGGFVYRDVPAGAHQLASEKSFGYGVTTHDFRTQPGKTYYFSTVMSDRAKALVVGMAVGGVAGGVIAGSVSSSEGPLRFVPVDEATGRSALADAKQSTD